MTATTTFPVYTAPTGLTTAISRTLKAEWTKFHTLPSTWRMTAMAIVTSIGLGVILCASQAGQWATMSASQRRSFDPTACSSGGRLPRRRRPAGLARRAIRDSRIRHRDDPVHLHRHPHPTSRASRQGSGQRGVRVPGSTAMQSRQLRSRSAIFAAKHLASVPRAPRRTCRPSSSEPLE